MAAYLDGRGVRYFIFSMNSSSGKNSPNQLLFMVLVYLCDSR